MKFFVDTADIKDIRELARYWGCSTASPPIRR